MSKGCSISSVSKSALQNNLGIRILIEDAKSHTQEGGLVSPTLSPNEFNELWDDVRAKADTAQEATEESTQDLSNPEGRKGLRKRRARTNERDSDFVATKLKDIFAAVRDDAQFTEADLEGLDRYLPRKIVETTRDQALEFISRGDAEGACKLLEDALAELNNQLEKQKHVDATPWKVSMAEILIDQGRRQEARAVLSNVASPTRNVSDSPDHQGTASDVEYAKMMEMAQVAQVEEELDLCRRAEDWDKVREVAQALHGIDPSYFDLDKPMDRFGQVRRILNAGMLQEAKYKQASDPQTGCLHLMKALEIYNHGCYTSKVFNEFFNTSEATVSGFDHSDCANIFFSAARVCHHFDSIGYRISPRLFSCKGPNLTCQDWKDQALHFLEQGRARALLDSINRGRVVNDVRRRLIKNNILLLTEAAVKVLRQRGSAMSSTYSSRVPSVSAGVPVSQLPMLTKLDFTRRNHGHSRADSFVQPDHSHTVRQSLTLATSNLSNSTTSSLPASPAAPTPTLTKEENSRLRVQMNWRRCLLGVLTQGQVGSSSSIEDLRSRIPSDTLVVEFALASRAPCGIMVIIAATDGVKAVEWTETNTEEIRRCIRNLRDSMQTFDDRTSQPGSPEAPLTPTLNRRDSTLYQERLDDLLRKYAVAPVEPHLKDKKNLIIIPSGDLAHVPWRIFFDLPTTVVPSLEIWTRLQSQSASPPPSPKLCAISTAPVDAAKAAAHLPGSLRNIPFSRIEALYLARTHSTTPFLADNAPHAALAAHAHGATVLHIAAHSSFDPSAPLASALDLAAPPLSIRHWPALRIAAPLVVFSACLSAYSRAYDSGATIGFAHALLGTGSACFVGSLWRVDDRATLLLMVLFYGALRGGKGVAEALWEAQRGMQNLTPQGLNEIVDVLECGGVRAKGFVVGQAFLLRELRATDARVWREERFWAAFVVMGYGAGRVYPGCEDEEGDGVGDWR
ncbi:CHAT domain-containing protein [Boeremia exigua]|uniref:CHAT domain-containing protein n=1 Tax=Boeremia exigua TaxID=749465 RepID=UPI001E8D65A4|nr:CHAT domain-containing protein [Boeremia exigua]KAH6615353.1 CHAT domain-containing protein [Boeremia exigua]